MHVDVARQDEVIAHQDKVAHPCSIRSPNGVGVPVTSMTRFLTSPRLWEVVAVCFAVLTLFASANRIYEIFDHAQTPDYAKEYRAIAHDIPFGTVAMLCGDAKDI